MIMERKSFTFFGSFCDALSRIKNKTARCDAYDAIIRYALNGTEPDLDSMADAAALAFIMAKPVLDSSRKKAEAGRIGGSSKTEANASNAEANTKRDRDRDREGILKESTKEKQPRFQAPTVDQVREYCRERKNNVDPQRFVSHYEAVGWKIGKNPMKDWKAAVRTWERNEEPKKKPSNYWGEQPKASTIKSAYQRALEEEAQYEEEGA